MPGCRYDVRREVSVSAAMKLAIREPACVSARLPDVVRRGRAVEIARFPACVAQPPAEVGIFPVQKIAFVKAADARERVPSNEHARARYPVHWHAGVSAG